MRMLLAAIALSLLAVPGRADEPGGGVVLGAAGPVAETCVEVEIGGEQASGLDCVNQRLEREVAKVRPPMNVAPLDATSSAVQVGGFNQAGLRQQYGPNFGNSIVPFRPAKTYGTPLRSGR